MVGIEDILQPDARVTASIAEGEAVLILPEKGQIKVLNEVGTFVWQHLDGARPVQDIVDAICQHYLIEASQAEADTLRFLDELVTKGLVAPREAGSDLAEASA